MPNSEVIIIFSSYPQPVKESSIPTKATIMVYGDPIETIQKYSFTSPEALSAFIDGLESGIERSLLYKDVNEDFSVDTINMYLGCSLDMLELHPYFKLIAWYDDENPEQLDRIEYIGFETKYELESFFKGISESIDKENWISFDELDFNESAEVFAKFSNEPCIQELKQKDGE
jgi:hypothetical protein